jgi:hypothetical protein
MLAHLCSVGLFNPASGSQTSRRIGFTNSYSTSANADCPACR